MSHELKQLLRYEPETGRFFWLKSPRYDVAIGDRAGWKDKKFWRLKVKGRLYKASRLAWFFNYDKWPKDQIDHINGDSFDDRIVNLREASNQQNCWNRRVTTRNKLGERGIHFNGRYFIVQVYGNGKASKHFKDLADAKVFRDKAVLELHGDFARQSQGA